MTRLAALMKNQINAAGMIRPNRYCAGSFLGNDIAYSRNRAESVKQCASEQDATQVSRVSFSARSVGQEWPESQLAKQFRLRSLTTGQFSKSEI